MIQNDDIALREALEPHWFRIEARHWSVADEWGDHSYTSSEVIVRQISVLKHTPKGAWLGAKPGEFGMPKKLVLREYQHRGRAFAAPTLEQAKEDFRKRKQFRIDRLQAQINRAEREIALLDEGSPRLLG